jgi:hypothetical protein
MRNVGCAGDATYSGVAGGVARLFSQGARGAVEHSKRRRIDLIDSGSSALDRK